MYSPTASLFFYHRTLWTYSRSVCARASRRVACSTCTGLRLRPCPLRSPPARHQPFPLPHLPPLARRPTVLGATASSQPSSICSRSPPRIWCLTWRSARKRRSSRSFGTRRYQYFQNLNFVQSVFEIRTKIQNLNFSSNFVPLWLIIMAVRKYIWFFEGNFAKWEAQSGIESFGWKIHRCCRET